MKRILLLLLSLIVSGTAWAQSRKGVFRLSNTAPAHQLYVTLDPGAGKVAGLEALQRRYGFTLQKAIPIPEEKLAEMERKATEKGNNAAAVQRLRNSFKLIRPGSGNGELLELAQRLEALDGVAYCSLLPLEPVPPPGDIMPVTPSYEAQQTYIGPNPGVNMQFAWDAGLNGSGIRIRDVEYGFNKNHEEFNDNAGAFMQPGMTVGSDVTAGYTEHGTAVFGIVFADHGSYGVSGMAYGAQEMVQFPEWQQTGYDRVLAVSEAIEASAAGDVIIYEMQTYGVNDAFVPAEYENLVWDLTKAATDAGIIVIAAAGNGNADLDSASYAEYMDRGNSGAIIVGGGTPDLQHNKISYSTYGTRVDVQAWASNVRSSGYGDFVAIGFDFNQRYTNFSGTSSATPIVASCAVVLQSHFHDLTGSYLTPAQIRDILVTTGIAQGTGGHIGPIPNMEAAIAAVNLLATEKFDALSFVLYPNPATDVIAVSGNMSETANVEIVDSVGQTVYSGLVSGRSIPVSNLASGMYFVKVSESGRSAVKKIVKR